MDRRLGAGVRTRVRDGVGEGVHAGALLAVAAALAWATGRPLVFPSLGPSAYVLAATPTGVDARDVLGGHAVGVLAGLAAYHGLAGEAVIVGTVPPTAAAGARLAVSAVASVALTAAGMAAADARHAPACATTLIVSLGLLSAPADAVVIGVGVVAVFLASRCTRGVAAALAEPADR